jgi:uncharacterized protein YndB with AHSA1/START domain
MEKDLKAKVTVQVNAPTNKVWEALTTPELIKQYFFGTQAESEWKVGSPIYFRGTWEGKEYEDKGTILDVQPGKFLRYNYWSSFSGTEDKPENYADITYELIAKQDATELLITQDGLDSEERKDHSEQNWKLVLNNLKQLLEN